MPMPDEHELFSAEVINEIDGAFRAQKLARGTQELARYSQAAVDLRLRVSGFLSSHNALIGNQGIVGFVTSPEQLLPVGASEVEFAPIQYETWVELKRPVDMSGVAIQDDRVPSVVRIVTNSIYQAPEIKVKKTGEDITTVNVLSKDVTLDSTNQTSLFLGVANIDTIRGVSTDMNGSASIIAHRPSGLIEVVELSGYKRWDGHLYKHTPHAGVSEYRRVVANGITPRDMLYAVNQGVEILHAVRDAQPVYQSLPGASA